MHYTLNFGDLLPYAQFFTDGLALTAKIALIVTIFGTLLGILGAVVRSTAFCTTSGQATSNLSAIRPLSFSSFSSSSDCPSSGSTFPLIPPRFWP